MPDIVELADDKAEIKKQQQKYRAQLVPQLYLPCHKVQKAQQNAAHAAVQVGKPLLERGLQAAAHVARHLAHGIQKPQKRIGRGDIQPEALWKIVYAGLCGLQRRQGRKGQHGSHADGNGGKHRHEAQVRKEPAKPLGAADLIAEKHQRHKNTGEQANIVVGENGQEQRQGIQNEFPFPQKGNFPQNHQRQQGKGVQPHNIPLVAQGPGAQGVKASEESNGKIIFPMELFQQQPKEKAGKAQLDGHQKREIGQQPLFRYQNAEQVQWRRQIVGYKAQVVHAHAHIPAVQQRVSA